MNTSILVLALLFQPVVARAADSVTILSMDFQGNHTIDSDRLRAQMRQARQGGAYREEMLKFELGNLERYYRDEGFLRAVVGPPSLEFSEIAGRGKLVSIRVAIVEGPRYSLARLDVRDARVLGSAALLQMSPLGKGMPYGRSRLSAWMEKVTEAYHSLGYLRFQAALEENIDEARHTVDCTLKCVEGGVYRVREISVVGLESEEAARDFTRRLLFGVDMPYNPEMLVVSLHLLNQMGIYRPMTERHVKVTIDDDARAVNLEFHPVPLRKPGTSSQD